MGPPLRRRAPFLLLAIALTLHPAGAAAQENAPETMQFGTETTLVRVPVFVTDGEGRAVAGLTAADFEVREDGRERTVVGFRQIDSAEYSVAIEGPEALLARRQFLLLFDLSFSSVSGLIRSREAAASFVETRLRPMDLAGVATYSTQNGVRLLLGFTSDKAQIRRAIETLGLSQVDRNTDALGLAFDVARPEDLRAEESEGGGRGGLDIEAELRSMQVNLRNAEQTMYLQRVSSLLEQLAQLGGILDSVAGRKQLIYFSGGFDVSALTGADGQQARDQGDAVARGRLWEVQGDSRFGDIGVSNWTQRMIDSFRAADVVVHTVDVTGLTADADVSSFGRGVESGRGREALASIARASGGRFIKGFNDLSGGLDDILESTRVHYLLAFEPARRQGAGRSHGIEVKVRTKGLHISHRTRYKEPPPYHLQSQMARRLQAGEAIAKGMSGGEIAMQMLALPYRDEAGTRMVRVVAHVPAEALLAGVARAVLKLDLYGYAIDDQGSLRDTVAFQAQLDLARWGPLLESQGLQIQTAFALPAGRHSLRLLIRDGQTGRIGIQTREAIVPAFEPGELILYPPLFMANPNERLILNLPSRDLPEVDSSLRVAAEAFTPRLLPHLLSGEKQSICLMAFTGQQSGAPDPAYKITAQLVDSAGNPARLGRLRVARSLLEDDGFQRLVLDVTPGELAPGDYALKVKIVDPLSGDVREASQSVRVN